MPKKDREDYRMSHRLIVELDGGQHDSQKEHDARRTSWLEADGYRVIRFWNNEVIENLDSVLKTISDACGGVTPPMR